MQLYAHAHARARTDTRTYTHTRAHTHARAYTHCISAILKASVAMDMKHIIKKLLS